MPKSLISYLMKQPVMRLLRGLAIAHHPRHLRELAKSYSLSASGVSDILRRLKAIGVLIEKREGNRRYFSLNLTNEDRECLNIIFKAYEYNFIAARSVRFSKAAQDKLQWMDEALEFYDQVKGRRARDHTS